MNAVKRGLRRLAVGLATLVPATVMERVVYGLVAGKVGGMSPENALRLLFRLDQRLYTLQGATAIAYGQGVHPKHRLIAYHEFFIAHVRPGERVLDVGCGVGVVAADVAQRTDAVVTGIDCDAKKISQARTRYQHPRLTFIVGDALTDLPAGRFDAVILSNVLEHLEHRVAFLQQLTERIRPSRCLIRVPLFERDWRVALKHELGVDYRLDPTHTIEHRAEELLAELAQASLRVVTVQIRWGELWAVGVPAEASLASEPVESVAAAHE